MLGKVARQRGSGVLSRLKDRLLGKARQLQDGDLKEMQLLENIAWMLEFHHGEAKPDFWRFFERLDLIHAELLDDAECLAFCERTNRKPFKRTAQAKHLAFEYRFDPTQEFKGPSKTFYLLGEEDKKWQAS